MEFHSFVAAAARKKQQTPLRGERRERLFLPFHRGRKGGREEGRKERRKEGRKEGRSTRVERSGVRRRAHNAAIYWPKFAMPRFTRRGDIAYDAIIVERRTLSCNQEITSFDIGNIV